MQPGIYLLTVQFSARVHLCEQIPLAEQTFLPYRTGFYTPVYLGQLALYGTQSPETDIPVPNSILEKSLV